MAAVRSCYRSCRPGCGSLFGCSVLAGGGGEATTGAGAGAGGATRTGSGAICGKGVGRGCTGSVGWLRGTEGDGSTVGGGETGTATGAGAGTTPGRRWLPGLRACHPPVRRSAHVARETGGLTPGY